MFGFLKLKRRKRYVDGWQWYRLRGWFFLPVLVFLFIAPLIWPVCKYENGFVIWPVGTVLFALGLAIRIWAQMHLHYRLDEQKVLTTTGPYALLRNPIYVGNTLILLGLCVVSGVLWFLPVMALMCVIVFPRVVRYEEGHLIKKYGEPYEAYLASVPRWWPKSWKCPEGTRLFPKEFFVQSVVAEAYNLLYLIPFIVKEILGWR